MEPSTLGKRRTPPSSEAEGRGSPSKRQHVPGTCQWVTTDEAFREWSQQPPKKSILWIHGPPGVGKTFLCRHIAEHLQHASAERQIAVFFCDAHTTPRSLARSLLQQIGQAGASSSPKGKEVSTESDPPPEPAPDVDKVGFQLWDKLAETLTSGSGVDILVDGLDEMKQPAPGDEGGPFDVLSKLISLCTTGNKLLITSRETSHFWQILQPYLSLVVKPAQVKDDLDKFVRFKIADDPNAAIFSDETVSKLIDAADGNFLWAELAIEAMTGDDVALPALLDKGIPKFEELYARILQTLTDNSTPKQKETRDLLFQWILHAIRPMSMKEISHIISIELDGFIRVPDIDIRVLDACGSLVKVENEALRFFHASLRDYLTNQAGSPLVSSKVDSKTAHACLAKTCLRYLCHPESLLFEIADETPLMEYATLYWVHHAVQADADEKELQALINDFFKTPNAFIWADKLLPTLLHRSLIPIAPRPRNAARFFHLFTLERQLVNYFKEGPLRTQFENRIISFLQNSYESALKDAEQADPPDAADVLQRTLDLAEVYGWLPTHRERAGELLTEALNAKGGPTLADKALSIELYQAAADHLKRAGKFEQAESLLQQLLDLAQDSLESDDPRMMFALDGLGWVKMRRGNLDGAAKDLNQALGIAISRYGSRSPMTLRSKVTLAEVLSKLGRTEEAEQLCQDLIAQLSESRHRGIPLFQDTVSNLNVLAAVYNTQGRFAEARNIYHIVSDEREKLFGADHPLTLWATMQLGMTLKSAGDLELAKDVLGKLLPKQQIVLGVAHADVGDTKRCLVELGVSV